jgi:hypothetical protein
MSDTISRGRASDDLRPLGNLEMEFSLVPTVDGALDPISGRSITPTTGAPRTPLFVNPPLQPSVLWFHPGAPAFEAFRKSFRDRYRARAFKIIF